MVALLILFAFLTTLVLGRKTIDLRYFHPPQQAFSVLFLLYYVDGGKKRKWSILDKIALPKILCDVVIMYNFQVLKESFKIYCAINDGIINLVDKVS